MKKIISIVLTIILITCIFTFYTKIYAAGETPTVTSEAYYNDGKVYVGVKFKLDNLEKENDYEYAILTTNSTPTNSDWKSVNSYKDSDTTANISYAVSSGNNEAVFRTQDHIYFSLRTSTYNSNTSAREYITVIDKQKCDLTLPDFFMKRIKLSTLLNNVSFKPLFNIEKGQYQFVKITDTNVIEKWQACRKDNTDANLEALKAVLPSESSAPTSGWKDFEAGESYDGPNENGFYYVWTKAQEDNTITLLGINIMEVTNKLDPSSNSGNNANSGTGTSSGTSKSDPDETVATTILPKTGKGAVISFAIISMIIVAIILNKRYKTIDK